jgi:signal transduction histidine kinase
LGQKKPQGHERFQEDSLQAVHLAEKAKQLVSSKNDSALVYSNHSLRLAKSLKSPYLIARAYDHKGIVLHELGEWKNAIAYIDSAIQLNTSRKRYTEAGQSFLHLGNLYKSEGDMHELSSNFTLAEQSFEQALKHYEKAKALFESQQDSLWIGHAHLNIGAVYYLLYQNLRALQEYRISLRLFIKYNDTSGIPSAYTNMGIVYETLEKTDSAVYYYRQARQAFIQNKNLKNWINANINLIEVLSISDSTAALRLLLEADSLSRILNNTAQKAMIQERLYRLFSERGNDRKALLHLERYTSLKDSLLNTAFKTEELNIRFQTARQKKLLDHQKAENLKKELSLQQAQQERARLLTAVLLISLLLFSAIGTFLWTRRMNRIIRRQKETIHEQEVKDLEQAKELAAINAMIEGQTKERVRIAEDLHDRLGSVLVAARMQHEAQQEELKSISVHGQKVMQLIDKAIEDTREISHNLISSVLVRFGLLPALRDLKESIEVTERLQFDIVAQDTITLPSAVELQVFRAVQEMLNNALKHAAASHIHLHLSRTAAAFKLEFTDNGQGFDPTQSGQGLGLKNIEKRINSVGGRIELHSAPGKGTTFVIQIPLAP